MARMYPERLPETVESDAERRLFDAFANGLDNSYTIYAGVRWISRRRFGALPGEADFVIVHPGRGLIVIEAKGGGISHDASSGEWFSRDRFGNLHEIKNPVAQAQSNFYDLCDKILEIPGAPVLRESGGHGVAFPDVSIRGQNLAPDLPRDIIIDAGDLNDIQAAVERLFRCWTAGNSQPVGRDGMAAIHNALARTWEVRLSLDEAIRREGEHFRTLTSEQFNLLDLLAGQNRALITGCAGSGKTFLAAEKARRLAEQGFNTLLTCFNKNLAAWMRTVIDPCPERLRIQHFHELAFDLVSEAGLTSRQPDNGDMSTYFTQTLPELLLDAADQMDVRFDAIVVDEGQDFREEWWVPLQALLSEPDEAVWYIFYDNQQSIYTTGAAPPFSGNPYPLTTNMRSTQAIHDHIKAFYDTPVGCRGPEGRLPHIIQAANPQDEMKRRLHQLVNEEHVNPTDIVILTPASQERSQWKQGQRIGNLTLTWSPPNERLQVPVSTIHSFKGLESPVVILTEMDTISDYQPEDRLRLVAYSRAMSELVVIENAG